MTTLNAALEPLRQVIADISAWKPTLATHLHSQVNKLESLCTTRGTWQVLMIDLPAAGKHLDKCLSSGHILKTGYPHSLGSVKTGSLLFFELYCLIFNGCAYGEELQDDADHDAVFFLRTLLYLYKKVQMPCPEAAVRAAVEEYREIDESLRSASLYWSLSPNDFQLSYDWARANRLGFSDLWDGRLTYPVDPPLNKFQRRLLTTLDVVVRIISSMVPAFHPEELLPKHGPGAVADLRHGEDKYSLPTWTSRLEAYFPQEYYAYSSEEIAHLHWVPRSFNTVPARLMAVPKTLDKPRLITVEPTSNQFLQQGLLRWFRRTLPAPIQRAYDPHSQIPSREMAMQASKTEYHATVDLSSASDRLSCWTVERAFLQYGGILPYLYATRSDIVTDSTPCNVFNGLHLQKFAGQGSAVTFPVQSIVYTMICITAVLAQAKGPVNAESINVAAGEVRVFGDDLIVPKVCLEHLREILELLQLKVNDAKTHHGLAFRESCGMDAFRGADVTPLYLTQVDLGNSPRSLTSWIDVSNNAHRKGLWRLMQWMDGKLPEQVKPLIPTYHLPLGCITRSTFLSGLAGLGITRESKTLHRPEVRGLCLSSTQRTKAREDHGSLLQFFLEGARKSDSTTAHLEVRRNFEAGYATDDPFLTLRKGWVPVG